MVKTAYQSIIKILARCSIIPLYWLLKWPSTQFQQANFLRRRPWLLPLELNLPIFWFCILRWFHLSWVLKTKPEKCHDPLQWTSSLRIKSCRSSSFKALLNKLLIAITVKDQFSGRELNRINNLTLSSKVIPQLGHNHIELIDVICHRRTFYHLKI